MQHNRQPRLFASEMRPDSITIDADEPVTVSCPRCGRWSLIRKGMVEPHKTQRWTRRSDNERAQLRERRCWGSGQRMVVDLTSEEWVVRRRAWLASEAYTEALASADSRRSARVHRKGMAPVLPAVCQIAAARAA